MKVCRILPIGLLIVSLSIAQAQFDATFVQTPLSPNLLWGKWGNDLRNSHYNPNAAGPTNPRLLWSWPGGAIDEPLVDDTGVLWIPVHPYSNSLRYTHYRLYSGLSGGPPGTVWPYWGQAATPLIFQTAVYFRTSDGTFVDFLGNWPVLVLAGGQYDIRVYSPDPLDPLTDGLLWIGNVGWPAYRSGLTAYTDGASGYFMLGDNTGLVRAVMVFWVVIIDTGERFPYLYIDAPLAGAGAVYSLTGVSTYNSDVMVSTHHSGDILVYNTMSLGAPSPAWGSSLQGLSTTNPPDSFPIDSDICDRPAVFSSNNRTLFVCATNYGRVYAVQLYDNNERFAPAKLWVAELGKPIMAGPSIGPDPINGNEETLYVVTRSSSTRSTLVAIRAADGVVKWQRTLQNVSRCNPTIDRNGRIFIGDDRGYLYAINPDGSILWARYLGASIRVSPALVFIPPEAGGPLDVLYVAASNRMLYAFVESTPIRIPPGGGLGTGVGGGW
ncbi:Outer membrane protein assembly factor BamB [bacterium HR15]|nr:Outer membrane protein assembly factor BamB [bacterium HR15]